MQALVAIFNSFKNFLPIVVGSSLLFACNTNPEHFIPETSSKKPYDAIPEKVTGLAKVVPEKNIVGLNAQATGLLKAVNVRIGDTITIGLTLFEIAHDLEDGKIEVIEAQIEAQRASLDASIAASNRTAAATEHAAKKLERLQKVYDQGAGTKQELEDAKSAWQLLSLDHKTAQTAIGSAEARLAEYIANLQLARRSRDNFFVKAPNSGVILDVTVSPGTFVTQGTRLGEFAPEGAMCVVAEIDELFAWHVRVGQQAFIRMQGGKDPIAYGQVIEVSPSLNQKSLFAEDVGKLEDRRVRAVKVKLENGQEKLLYGQRVECSIDVKN
jgi:multidrug resistance efflux pump